MWQLVAYYLTSGGSTAFINAGSSADHIQVCFYRPTLRLWLAFFDDHVSMQYLCIQMTCVAGIVVRLVAHDEDNLLGALTETNSFTTGCYSNTASHLAGKLS